MTTQEAIEYFENIIKASKIGKASEKSIEPHEAAVEALKKQNPMKPITHDKTNRADCPTCNNIVRGISKPFGNWCSHCGQVIDWKE